jgi:hypothetical protein
MAITMASFTATALAVDCKHTLAILAPIDEVLQALALVWVGDSSPIKVLAGLGVVHDVGSAGSISAAGASGDDALIHVLVLFRWAHIWYVGLWHMIFGRAGHYVDHIVYLSHILLVGAFLMPWWRSGFGGHRNTQNTRICRG